MATEGVTLEFTADAIDAIADVAVAVNSSVENIGARRLQTVMERVLDEISFAAPDRAGDTVAIDAAYVRQAHRRPREECGFVALHSLIRYDPASTTQWRRGRIFMQRAAAGVISVLLLSTAAADAGVTRIEISRREPFVSGQAFGSVGAYERIVGRFHGELDPAHDLNAGIVDLDKAPRNARGKVGYSSDFEILKPIDLAKGNGALLYDVNNRGNKRALIQFNNALPSNDPATPDHAGNGFLMRHGYTVVWSGWIPGLPAANNALRIEVPTAAAGAIEQMVWDEFLFNVNGAMQARLTFPATSTETRRATLLVRARNAEEPTVVAPDQWEFVDPQTIRLEPRRTLSNRRDLSAHLQGGQSAGRRHRLCRDARPRIVPALRSHGRSRHAQSACGRTGGRRPTGRWHMGPRKAGDTCATSFIADSMRTRATASSLMGSIRTSLRRGCFSTTALRSRTA